MCWIGEDNRKIAENDFFTYKLVKITRDKHVKSYFRNFNYGTIDENGDFKREDIKEKTINPSSINLNNKVVIFNGYHSYSGIVSVESIGKHKLKIYDEEYHDMIHYKIAVMKCVIPRGTEYYENEHGVIVSEKIVPSEIILSPNIQHRFSELD